MFLSESSVLSSFVHRLASRSILSKQEETALLGMYGHMSRLAAHVDFVHMGQRVHHSSLIVEGLAVRFGMNRSGDRQITCFYIPGDIADLPSAVSPRAGWGLATLTSTTILRLPHDDLRHLAATHPGIAEAFWRDCVVDGSISSEWLVNIGRRNAVARLAHLYCEMAIRYERAGQGSKHSFPLPATRNDLADATGLTPVHVNRSLRKLKKLVTNRSGQVTIHDWDELASIGEFDDTFMLLDRPAP